jgi:hypothetical protein
MSLEEPVIGTEKKYGEMQLAALFFAKKLQTKDAKDYEIAENLLRDIGADETYTAQDVLDAWSSHERLVRDSYGHEQRMDPREKE